MAERAIAHAESRNQRLGVELWEILIKPFDIGRDPSYSEGVDNQDNICDVLSRPSKVCGIFGFKCRDGY
jgi:hypothetical protein